mgnify:CR=1 FL=1
MQEGGGGRRTRQGGAGGGRKRQGEAGGGQKKAGAARSSPKSPGTARSSRKQPGAARGTQKAVQDEEDEAKVEEPAEAESERLPVRLLYANVTKFGTKLRDFVEAKAEAVSFAGVAFVETKSTQGAPAARMRRQLVKSLKPGEPQGEGSRGERLWELGRQNVSLPPTRFSGSLQ